MAFVCQRIFSSFIPKTLKLCKTIKSVISCGIKSFSDLKAPKPLIKKSCTESCSKPTLTFESSVITQCSVCEEIQFFRDTRNNFQELSFNDSREYGPPLAILLPWKDLDSDLLKRIIEIYGEKGFDVITVHLSTEQFLYPCVVGSAMSVVTTLIDYLNDSHKNRPYIFHGFSIGAYIYGEMMAQFSDHYDTYRCIIDNVRGCLWDSPVDVLSVKPLVGKHFYPNNCLKRWRCNSEVKKHFKNHFHDSVSYWVRSRDSFCDPLVKVPYVFFTAVRDVLSNPGSLQCVRNLLEDKGVPIYQKTWCDSPHGHHFINYYYEYIYGMVLFFNLSNLFPDECGKYKCSRANATASNFRLSKTARDNFH